MRSHFCHFVLILFILCIVRTSSTSTKKRKGSTLVENTIKTVKIAQPEGDSALALNPICKAIDEGNLETAVELCEQKEDLCYKELEYAIETKDSDFIVNFIKQSERIDEWAVVALYMKGSKETREKVFGEIGFGQITLKVAAESSELMCSPEKLFDLLGRIKTSEGQEDAIDGGIWVLFKEKRTDCFDSLLAALKGKEFLNKHLEEVAIREAFEAGVYHHDDMWVERFFDHPAVTSEVYVHGLVCSGDDNAQDPVFKWLLAEADRADLQTIQSDEYYADRNTEFHDAVEQALRTASPAGSRPSTPEKAKRAKELFNELTTGATATQGPGDIIASYIAEEAE